MLRAAIYRAHAGSVIVVESGDLDVRASTDPSHLNADWQPPVGQMTAVLGDDAR